MGKSIPAELLFEILLILPVKDLRRLESVSKSFSSIIHDADFINCHLRRAIETNSSSTLISLLTLRSNSRGNVADPDVESLICFSDLNSPGKVRSFQFEKGNRVLSCNGLLCFVLSSDCYIAISNLFTKPSDYHIVPIPPSVVSESEGYNRLSSPFYGFGYDSVNDDYKVLVIDVCISENRCYAETRVYSLKHNAWKPKERWDEIDSRERFPRIVNPDKHETNSPPPNGVVASCAFHWLAVEDFENGSKFILAFDFITEDFYEIALPDIVRKKVMISNTRLGVLKGCLCVSSGDGWRQRYLDIWVMKDYNIDASWTKILHLDHRYSITPIYSRNEYEVLMLAEGNHRFCWYDLRNTRMIECVLGPLQEYHPGNQHFFHTATICLDTLVSVNDYRQLWGKDRKGKRLNKVDSDLDGTKRRRIQDDDDEEALESFVRLRDSFSIYCKHNYSSCS